MKLFYFKLKLFPQRIKTSAECAEVAFSLSDSPPTLLHPSCVRNTFPPLHPSHVLKFISHYLCRLVSPLPSPHIHPHPNCSPLSVTVSSHSINQTCEAVQRCMAQSCSRPITATHSPSLSQSL